MTQEQKKQISEQLRAYCEQKGSQNKASVALGISNGTISKILAGNWDTIANEMWRTIGAQVGSSEARGWQVVKTRAYDVMTFTLANIQADHLTAAVIGGAGSGKTEAIKKGQ